jgi:hypothetical protein
MGIKGSKGRHLVRLQLSPLLPLLLPLPQLILW